MNRSLALALSLPLGLGLGAFAPACSDSHDDDGHTHDDGGTTSDGSVTTDGGASGVAPTSIAFEARVGAAKFSCATRGENLGTSKATVEPLDFRVYVHDVKLVRADGVLVPYALTDDGTWQKGGIALLDFEDKTGTCANGTTETNTTLRGTAPAGTYTGLSFKIGLPDAENFSDPTTAPSPLNLSGLYWSWASGYKFARIDAKVVMDMGDAGMAMGDAGMGDGGMAMGDGGGHGGGHGGADSFLVHLGSAGCSGSPTAGGVTCTKPNRGQVTLTGVDFASKKIVVDYAALVSGVDLMMDHGGAPGCMSEGDDPECASVLSALGVNLASGAGDATTQKLFRVE
ncbi:MAG: metallo-mystery pair system four-Cys motif protein [Polyangiaceae bacterium]